MAGKGRAQGGMSGGFRHGAGGKKKEHIEEIQTRRSVALDVFNPDEWRATLVGWRDTARATGNYALLFPLLPYIMGGAKMEIEHSGSVQLVQLETARTVLRVVGGTEKRAS